MNRLTRLWNDERGMSLVFALFGLVTLTVLGLGLTGIGMTSLTVSNNEAENSEALAIADAGISHAKRLMLWQDWVTFDQFLTEADGNGCTGDELSMRPVNGNGTYPAVMANYPSASTDFITSKALGGRSFGVGKYYVSVCDDVSTDLDKVTNSIDANPNHDANKRVLVRSTGIGRNGATATIESVFAMVEVPALFVNGNVAVSGDIRVEGGNGAIYSNGNMNISGGPCAEQYFMSTGAVTGATNAEGGPSCSNAQADLKTYAPVLPVPAFNPADFVQYATFKLDKTGWIYTRDANGAWVPQVNASNNGQTVRTAIDNVIGASWSFTSQGNWQMNSGSNGPTINDVKIGNYYIAGTNLEIQAGPGDVNDPVKATFIVDGWVDIAGGAVLTPNLFLDWIGGSKGVVMIAGTDIEWSGNASGTFTGLYYAHDQIQLSGTPQITGQVIAANLADIAYPASGQNSDNKVPYSGAMQIGGNVNIRYDNGGMMGGSQISWRECRGADPDNPCGNP